MLCNHLNRHISVHARLKGAASVCVLAVALLQLQCPDGSLFPVLVVHSLGEVKEGKLELLPLGMGLLRE